MDRSGMAALMAYDDLCARIYNDARATPGTRELLLAIAWALTRDPEARTAVWPRIATLLGKDRSRTWRHRTLVSDDAPRYRPHDRPPPSASIPCGRGPRTRPRQEFGMTSVGWTDATTPGPPDHRVVEDPRGRLVRAFGAGAGGRSGISAPGSWLNQAMNSRILTQGLPLVARANGSHSRSAIRPWRTGDAPVAGRPTLRGGLVIALLRRVVRRT